MSTRKEVMHDQVAALALMGYVPDGRGAWHLDGKRIGGLERALFHLHHRRIQEAKEFLEQNGYSIQLKGTS